MSKLDGAMSQLSSIETLANQDRWVNRVHPSIKLVLTIFYIAVTVSFPKYQLGPLLGMILYPVILFTLCELSWKDALYRLRIVLPLVMVVGIANPFLDREIVLSLGPVGISGGVLSMLTLMGKGVLAVLASYLLIATTSIEKLCYGMQCMHFPKVLTTEVLLIYRYISVLLKEASRVTTAYHLRAPGQKGIAFSAWGSLVGQMLLRSMDRANHVYQSMCLRGFTGQFPAAGTKRISLRDWGYLAVWMAVILLLRLFPVMEWVGAFVKV